MNIVQLLIIIVGVCPTNALTIYPSRVARVSRTLLWGRRNKGIIWDDNGLELTANENLDDYRDIDDNVRQIHQSNKMKEIFKPKTPKQKGYYNDINDDALSLVIASGPAGTGKTLFPTQHAAKLLLETEQKIIVTRPLISVDEELGYLPGTINQKMDPWIIPIFDVLREFFPQKTLNTFIAEKRLEIVPLAFMRGRTFKDTFIIGDELQNTSNKQMLMLLTRLGENSRMVITGDIHQCDNTENGLNDLLIRVSKRYGQERNDEHMDHEHMDHEHMDHEHMDHEHIRNDLISIVEFDTGDIQRSAIITTILDLYES
jgi:phosphate starvation-inducible PhoH-like protein